MTFKAGFVTIAGEPNSGKSTLLNALMGLSLSAVTPKVQTTRHRIKGILNGPDYQVVFSDTPGILVPAYTLHKRMMHAVDASMADADLVLLLLDVRQREIKPEVKQKIEQSGVPLVVVINKVDLSDQATVEAAVTHWTTQLNPAVVVPISALHSFNLEQVVTSILSRIPEGEPYFGKEDISDRNTRFFAAELIRESILTRFEKEIPYSCEVTITQYEEDKTIDRIYAEISVIRESQKAILLGHKGAAIRGLGIESRKKLEKLTGKKVFLSLTVKVRDDWRDDDRQLDRFGYTHDS